MGYLSCNAESAIAVSTAPPPSEREKKPIKIQQFHYSDIEAATNGFSDQKLLGKGSHGWVYQAVLRGRRVAVKKPAHGLHTAHEADNEIEILSKIHSPRLVNLLGFANNNDARDRLLVVEFMSNGTLYDVLHSNNSRPINWGRRIKMAMQVAKAVDTLHTHNPPIIHRDIKSANVLIDRNFNARLGDFGLALRCGVDDDCRLRSTPPAGTMGYLDPCYVTPDNLSTKTDVFSFGILLLEIISGRKAIDVGYSPPSIVDWAIPLVKKGKLGLIYDPRIPPLKDPLIKRHLALIACKCVRSCRERRPSMKEVVDWLNALCKMVPINAWNGFNNACMMVEAVGHPVEMRSGQEEGLDGRQKVKDSRRVFSDLGLRSNLIDLMTGADGKSGFVIQGDEVESELRHSSLFSRSIFSSARYASRGRTTTQARAQSSAQVFSGMQRNKSVGHGPELFAETEDEKPHHSRS